MEKILKKRERLELPFECEILNGGNINNQIANSIKWICYFVVAYA